MKIGFDAKRAFLNEAGLGNYSRTTLNALREYFPEHEYILYTPELRADLFPEQEFFEVYSPDSPASKLFKSLWRSISLGRQLQKHEIELYHGLSHELPADIHKTGVPAVVTIHDLIFLRYPQFYKPIDRNIYSEKIKYSCGAARKIIAISNQTRDDIIHFLNVNPEKIEVVYQAVSPRFFAPEDKNRQKEVIGKYNLPENYFLSLGTIEKRKNQLNILKALIAANIGLPLVIVGKPTAYAFELSKYIEETKLGNSVIFLDSVPDCDIPFIYRQATALVYVSFFEGFGLPVIEAMASGCPVVTSGTSCLPEAGGDAALYCNPSDVDDIARKIKDVAEDSTLRQKLIEKGRLRALDFTPEKTARALMDVYNKVVSNEK